MNFEIKNFNFPSAYYDDTWEREKPIKSSYPAAPPNQRKARKNHRRAKGAGY